MILVEIDYSPADAEPQTLTAVMDQDRFDYLTAMTRNPARFHEIVQIRSKIRPDSPAFGWTFEVGRIELRVMGEVH